MKPREIEPSRSRQPEPGEPAIIQLTALGHGLRVKQLAEALGVSVHAIYQWISRGMLDETNGLFYIGGQVRIDPELFNAKFIVRGKRPKGLATVAATSD